MRFRNLRHGRGDSAPFYRMSRVRAAVGRHAMRLMLHRSTASFEAIADSTFVCPHRRYATALSKPWPQQGAALMS